MHYRVILLFLLGLLPARLLWAILAQQAFSDWWVTCNNQNFCMARNTGEHHGLVMTLSCSAGAHTDAVLRTELGGLESSSVKESDIAPRLLLDGAPLSPSGEHRRVIPWQLATDDPATTSAFLQTIQDAKAITLQKGAQNLSLVGLKTVPSFIDAQQERVGSETAWIEKGDEPPLGVPPAPVPKGVAVTNPTPAPPTRQEHSELLGYDNWQISGIRCSIDPLCHEMCVMILTDDKALLMIGCEAGVYNTIDLVRVVSRMTPLTLRAVRLNLPFKTDAESRDMELTNATFDEKSRELATLAKGRGLVDCGIQTRWRYDGQRFRLVRYAQGSSCDNRYGSDAWPTPWITR